MPLDTEILAKLERECEQYYSGWFVIYLLRGGGAIIAPALESDRPAQVSLKDTPWLPIYALPTKSHQPQTHSR